jgi:ribosomal protein S13
MIIPNAYNIAIDPQGGFFARVSKLYVPTALVLVDKIQTKHAGWGRLAIDTPYVPRTMKGSRKFHALCASLASIWGVGLATAKEIAKDEAVGMSYRTKEITVRGKIRRVPISEADASAQEEVFLIETALRLGAEAGHDLEAEYQMKLQEEEMK